MALVCGNPVVPADLAGMMAIDNYHPSTLGCAAWARELAQAVELDLPLRQGF